MKRFLAVAAALAGLFVMPMAAQATTTTTMHLPAGVAVDIGPAGCVAGDLFISGNGVLHTTVNNAGDSWTTGTIEGAVTDADAGYTGRGTAWFGVEQNNRNFVTHFTANTRGTLKDGTPLSIHQQGQFTFNAQGVPVVNNVTVTCS
jgi:hypothetical protein